MRFIPVDPTKLWRRYVLAICLVALLAAGILTVTVTSGFLANEYAVAINLSGRQRMLSQRIAFLSGLVQTQSHSQSQSQSENGKLRPDTAADLTAAVDLFERSHLALTQGDEQLGVSGRLSEPLRDIYFGASDLDTKVKQYVDVARKIIDDPAGTEPIYVQADVTALLTLLDRAVTEFEEVSHANARALNRVEIISFIAVLLILTFEALAIFLPAHLSIVKALASIARKEKENRDLDRKRVEAEASNRASAAFITNISQEFRTPLNGIIGMSQLMRATRLSEDQDGYNSAIQMCGQALLSVIENVLDMSRIDAGLVTLDEAPLEPSSVAGRALDSVRDQAQAKGLTVTLTDRLDDRPVLLGDAGRMQRVLAQLLTNAVTFTQTGSVDVLIEAVDGALKFTVTDTGPGIAASEIDRIFDRFVQLNDPAASEAQGKGLGLAVARGLVALMGGRIGVDSVPGAGASFWFELPLKKADREVAERFRQRNVVAETARDQRPLRVLVAEDVQIHQQLLEAALGKTGTHLRVVQNGLEVLEALDQEPFDLVLMDIHMPIMRGDEAIKRIRASGKAYADIPIIVLTADAMIGVRDTLLQIGATEYLSKPLDLALLQGFVDQHRRTIAESEKMAG